MAEIHNLYLIELKGGLLHQYCHSSMFAAYSKVYRHQNDRRRRSSSQIKYLRTERNVGLEIDYPVYQIGDTAWEMNHYGDANVAYRKWCERSFRINWFNVIAVMHTKNPEILAEFDKLPFTKKVCFVPFKTNLESGFYVNSEKYKGVEFWDIINRIAMGSIIAYDIWDMLIYGKKTPLTL